MNVKNTLKHFLGRYPALFFPAYRLTAPRHHIDECLFSPEKELVIEGFPRSANTFAVVAFRQAQGRDVSMGHHLHVEAQVLRAVRLGKPCIVLIRRPDDAIRSLVIRHPSVNMDHAYRRWKLFYSAALRVIDKVVMAPFEEVTRNYGDIIERLNNKFGTNYSRFEHTEANVKNVFQEIEEINKKLDHGLETHVARPSQKRGEVQVVLPHSNTRDDANRLFEQIMVMARKEGL
ncbi:MAG: hypothetical protein D6690_07920 [Nitrospirae bacterium]|nr:MAG: hypothetical protein D6690_07920 [Nitrospirota bacterium]